jgi:uncharacterized protein YfaS (alpha-2-macroglobulin family)
MKTFLLAALLFLGIQTVTTANNTFYIQCNKVYSEDEAVQAFFSSYYGYRDFPEEVELALYRVQHPESFFASRILQNYQSAVPDSVMKTLALVKNWTEKVKRQYNQPLEIGKLEAGLYVLETIGNGEASQIPIVVSKNGIITRNAGSEMVAYLSNRKTGEAVKSAKMMAVINSEVLHTNTRTSVARFDLGSATQSYNYVPVIAVSGDDVTVSQSYFYNYYNGQNKGVKSYVFTDRSAYRPGQWVYFKGIFRELKSFKYQLPTDSVVYQITDAQGNEVAKKQLALDDLASFNDSIFIEKTLPLGTYNINTFLGNDVAASNSWHWYGHNPAPCTFSIEEYKKPEYEVNVHLNKAQYVNGDDINVEIDAEYFFGAPVINADVEYKVIRTDYYVPWWSNHPFYWWYSDYYTSYQQQTVIQTGTGKLSWEGKFFVTVPSASKDQKNYNYNVVATVRDASRRSIDGSESAIVAHTEFSLSAYSDKYYFHKDEPIRVHVSAKDFSQKPVEAKVVAKLYNQYWSRNNERHLVETKEVTTNPVTGTTSVEFENRSAGYYYVVFESTDSRKHATTASCYSCVINPNDYAYAWWQQSGGGIQIMTDKKVYEAGDKVKAMVYLPHGVDALVTLNNNQLAHYSVHKFSGGGAEAGVSKSIEIDVNDHAYGKLDITVNYLHENTFYSKKEQITIIPKEQYLSVELDFDEAQYKPGELARATLKVLDAQGNPVPNADVTLSTIDESIFSLYPDQTKDIANVFYGNDTHKDYNYYQNHYNVYSYSKPLSGSGMAWRMKKVGDIFNRAAFLKSREWHRYFHTPSDVKSFISGFVIDHSTGEPIPGAKVQIGNRKFHADENGYYAIGNIKTSHITIDFTHKGNTTTVENMLVYKGQETTLMVSISNSKNKKITIVNDPVVVSLENQQTLTAQEITVLDDEMDNMTLATGNAEPMAMGGISSAAVDGYSASRSKSSEATGLEQNQFFAEVEDEKGLTDLRKKDKSYKKAEVRTDFQDAIYWNPNVRTNARGEATVRIKLPDNLTTWRTTARVITKATKVGQTLAKVTVTKNLLVRMETPRFMTVGDRMLIATNIHNYLATPKQVQVSLTAKGITILGTEQIITVQPNGEQRIDWPIQSDWILDAKLTIKALTDEESDAMEVDVPVLPYGLQMVEANSMHLSNNATKAMELNIPSGIDLNSVNLEVSTAPSISAALLSSMDDLIGYPYGCVEQTMSRFLPNVIVANTLKAVEGTHVNTINEVELAKMVAQGLKRLEELQHSDGGWGWWENDGSHPFMTAYVANGVHMAKTAGYPVDEGFYTKAIGALRSQVNSNNSGDATTRAYQMMVAMQCDLKDLWESELVTSKTNAYEQSLWLQAAVLADDQKATAHWLSLVENSAITDGTTVLWGAQRFYYKWQDDQVETTANAIRGIAMADPDNDLLPGAVQWIMRQRKGNSWYNTRQTAMTIYGLNEVIKNEVNPTLELDIYANGILMEHIVVKPEDAFKKGSLLQLKGETYMVSLSGMPITGKQNILRRGDNEIKVVQRGKGSLYVNAKLSYFLEDEKDLELEKRAQAFTVEREYFKLIKSIDGAGHLTYKKEKLDEKNIKSGDDIMVKCKVIAKSAKDFVLIEDPIPAGCEFIRNTAGYQINGESEYNGHEDDYNNRAWGYWNWNRWYAHREYRDSKLAMTITSLPSGTYEYSYLLKAQIPGTFKVTPAVAQLMYYPEVRGFSEFSEMTIKE